MIHHHDAAIGVLRQRDLYSQAGEESGRKQQCPTHMTSSPGCPTKNEHDSATGA
jgi:hypothetical protein